MNRPLTQREADAVAVLRAAMDSTAADYTDLRASDPTLFESYRAKLLRVLRRGKKRKGAAK